jgi:protein-S-isoprenylcysteine O-methyltransferase Ste14
LPWLIVVVITSFFANRSGLPLLSLPVWLGYLSCAILAFLGISLLALSLKACPLSIIGGRDKSVLVTNGIYSYIRHPLCLSCILLSFSAAIGFMSLIGLAVAMLALVMAYMHASSEERELERRFGEKYNEYQSRVGMFFPKWKIMDKPR